MLILARSHQAFSLVFELIAIVLLVVPNSERDTVVVAQDAGFEIPVQLIGFPVIVMAVRTSNFVRKLAYALNPSTYRRSIRATKENDSNDQPVNFKEANKLLMKELGPEYCIHNDVCLEYINSRKINTSADWLRLYDAYSRFRDNKQQAYYTMSAILGDHFKSKRLCHIFDEMGRSCKKLEVQRLVERR